VDGIIGVDRVLTEIDDIVERAAQQPIGDPST